MKNKYLSKLLTLLSRQYTSHNSFTAFSMKSSNCYLDIQEEGGKKKKKNMHMKAEMQLTKHKNLVGTLLMPP